MRLWNFPLFGPYSTVKILSKSFQEALSLSESTLTYKIEYFPLIFEEWAWWSHLEETISMFKPPQEQLNTLLRWWRQGMFSEFKAEQPLDLSICRTSNYTLSCGLRVLFLFSVSFFFEYVLSTQLHLSVSHYFFFPMLKM